MKFWCKTTSDGYKRNDEVGRVGSNEMGESGGEDIGSVTHRAATLMDEFQFLHQNQNQKEERRKRKERMNERN